MDMAETVPPETEEALVVWVNTFSLSHAVSSLNEMSDGQAFWEMLREIDADFFSGDLPNRKQSDYSREQNLQFIYRYISSYLDDHAAKYEGFHNDDLKKLAMDAPSSIVARACLRALQSACIRANLVFKFLKMVLLVVIAPPSNEYVIERFKDLPLTAKTVLGPLIQEFDRTQEWPGYEGNSDQDSDQRSSRNSNTSSPEPSKDRIFLLEEKLANIRAQLYRSETNLGDCREENEQMSKQYRRLQESYEAVKKSDAEREDELKRLHSEHNKMEKLSIKDLELKISQQEEVIGRCEDTIAEQQSTEAELQRKADRLIDVDKTLQELQDDFRIQKKSLEEQTKRANMADKYKQKLQASQIVEKERDALRKEIDESRSRLQDYEQVRRENVKLQRANHEIDRTLSQSERNIRELTETKKRVLAESDSLRRDSKAMREALAKMQERVADLEDKIGGSEATSSPTTLVDSGLEYELAETSKQERDTRSRILELEKTNHQLVSSSTDKDSKLAVLQGQLDKTQDLSADQYAKYQQMRQEISMLQITITEVHSGHPIEGTETFKQMRQQLTAERKRCAELVEELSAAHAADESAKSDRGLLDKPELQMIEEVKRRNSLALMQLQAEYDALRKRHKRLEEEYDKRTEERNKAWHESHEAIIAKVEGDTKTAEAFDVNEQFKSIIQQTPTNASPETAKNGAEIYISKIEEGRARLAKAQEQIEEQGSLNKGPGKYDQQQGKPDFKSADSLCAGVIKSNPISEEQSYVQNLERELKLMSSAFHDLSGRLQLNSFVLQRRAEAPKSWLGKQRKAMEGVGGLLR